MRNVLKLDYIICKNLPEQEENYIHDNIDSVDVKSEISQESELKQDLTSVRNAENLSAEIHTKSDMPEWLVNVATKYGITCQKLVQNGILISGDVFSLSQAAKYGMATICYLPPEEAGLESEVSCGETVRTECGTGGITETFEKELANSFTPDMYVEGFEEVDITFLKHVYERHHQIPWKILETERCVVKEFSMEYLDALFELYAEEGMTDYIEPLYPYEKEKEYQQAYIDNMYRFYGYGMWIVCDKVTGKLIGRAGVEHREELDGELELGYAIGTAYQRQGYATEVCKAILGYVEQELEMPSICCLIEEGNTVSEHFAQKLGLGFSEEILLGEKNMRKYVYTF